MADTVIVGYARTPFGRLAGSLTPFKGTDLGGIAIRAALDRAGVSPDDVQHVVMGQVLQAGAGQIPSRQAAVAAGIPMRVPSETVNKVCASSMRAVQLADLMIRAGEHQLIVAGGMESMTNAPYLLPGARVGYRMGAVQAEDAMMHDGLLDAFNNLSTMGSNNDQTNAEFDISRAQQDEWAARSQQRAAAAMEAGRLAEEIVPITIAGRKGDTVVEHDEGPRPDTTAETLARLKPAFTKDGSTTAGNAPGINDGAAALVLTSDAYARDHGLTVLGRIVAYDYVADDSIYLCRTPGNAGLKVLDKAGWQAADLGHVEINEAFAAVAYWSARVLGVDDEIVNPDGGAIAFGHPIGASGARIIGTMVRQLRAKGGGRGLAAICSGGGQGDALLVEV